jgi:hypothetical protein
VALYARDNHRKADGRRIRHPPARSSR